MNRLYTRFLVLLTCVFVSGICKAQYMQQDVAYDIVASLDTSNHIITATCDITYTNNADQALDS